jgi:hypothetical protein
MWLPPLLYLGAGDLGADVVCARSWDFITVELACVCKGGLFANGLDLFFLLRPGESDVVVAG